MFISMDMNRKYLEGVPHKMTSTKDKPMTLPITTRKGIDIPEVEPLSSLWFVELRKVL